jgi:hypothetical protein
MLYMHINMHSRYGNRLTIRVNKPSLHDKCSLDTVNVNRIMLKVTLYIQRGSIDMVYNSQEMVTGTQDMLTGSQDMTTCSQGIVTSP